MNPYLLPTLRARFVSWSLFIAALGTLRPEDDPTALLDPTHGEETRRLFAEAPDVLTAYPPPTRQRVREVLMSGGVQAEVNDRVSAGCPPVVAARALVKVYVRALELLTCCHPSPALDTPGQLAAWVWELVEGELTSGACADAGAWAEWVDEFRRRQLVPANPRS